VKYESGDIKAVAYLQNKYNLGTTGIIDNKTYWYLWALDAIKLFEIEIKKGTKTQAELDNHITSIFNRLSALQYQNPDYSKDYYSVYCSQLLNYFRGGTEIHEMLMTLYPQGDAVDLAKFVVDLAKINREIM